MKKIVVFIIFILPLIVYSQGIQFEQNLSWEQIKQKAKALNKFIFMDCSASWCLPCKKMEKNVFQLKNVGDFMNDKFISVRVQMDTTKFDDEGTITWYAEAHRLKQQYKINAYPTYLFFSPNGKVVHRYSFEIPDSLFLRVAGNALVPDKQYFTLLENYQLGNKNYERYNYLATLAKQFGEDSLANIIAADYLHGYLNQLSEKELLQKKYLDFVNTFSAVLTSEDSPFNLFYKKGSAVDKIMKLENFSRNLVQYIIAKEEINPTLWPNKAPITTEPNWDQLSKKVRLKYNQYYTDFVIVNTQLKWYQQKKDKQQIIKYTVKRIDNYGLDTAGIGWAIINNIAYDLFFKYCNNKDTLNRAIKWMEIINKNHPEDQIDIDTYANLLYKVGRTKEAISWEEKAIELEEKAAIRENREADKSFREILDKMKSGIPTWVSL